MSPGAVCPGAVSPGAVSPGTVPPGHGADRAPAAAAAYFPKSGAGLMKAEVPPVSVRA